MMLRLLLVGLLCYLCSGLLHAQARVHLLDVNEGQALLLSHDGTGVLIDTGHAGEAGSLLNKLSDYGVERLELILLTHLHPDHASGYFRIREAFPDAPVISNCHPLPEDVSPDMTRWVNEALQRDTRHRCVAAGDRLHFADMRITVLWPYGFDGHNLNRHSLVLHIATDTRDILVMGDADRRAEQVMLEKQALPAGVDVLVVGHHGAADATSGRLLDRVNPGQAVISVNAGNVRGYPSPRVIERLGARDIPVRQTSTHGDIELK